MNVSSLLSKGGDCRPYSFDAAKYFFPLSAALFVVSFLLPNHYFPWLAFHSDFIATIALFALASGGICRFKKFTIPVCVLTLFVVFSIPLAQILLGKIVFSGDAVIASAYLFGFAVSVVLGRQLSAEMGDKFLFIFSACVVAVALFSVFAAIIQWLGLHYLSDWIIELSARQRPYANLGQPNNLSTLLCVGLISVIYIRERGTISGWTAFLLAGLLVFGIALTQSRTGWLIVGVFVFWWIFKRKKLGLKLGWIEVIGFVGLYIALVKMLPIIAEFLYLPVASEKAAEVGVRIVIWQQLLDAVWQGSFWGYGWNQLSYAQLSVAAAPAYPNSLFVEHSHNLFIDLLVWNGPIIGSVLCLAIICWGIKNAVATRTLASWYGLACVGALAVHSMLEFPIEYAYFLFPLGLIIGSIYTSKKDSRIKLYCPRWLAVGVLIVSGAFIGTVFYEYQKIEADARLLRFETARIGLLKAEKKAPDVKVLTQLREFLRFARTEAHANMSAAEIAWMEKVAHRYAYPPALFRYALALLLNGRADEGRLELVKLRQLHGEEMYLEAKENLRMLAKKYPQLNNI